MVGIVNRIVSNTLINTNSITSTQPEIIHTTGMNTFLETAYINNTPLLHQDSYYLNDNLFYKVFLIKDSLSLFCYSTIQHTRSSFLNIYAGYEYLFNNNNFLIRLNSF